MKKGYTLIELMVVLMISAIVSLVIFTMATFGINIVKSRELDRCNLQVISFVYYSQNYCKANQKTGYINFYKDKENFKTMLKCEGKEISEINVSSKLYTIEYMINKKKENYIEISNLGMINNEGEIEIECGKNKKRTIFLGAGGVYFEE